MSYKNYIWKVAAHDYNSPYSRNWLYIHSFFKYPKLLDVSRIVLGIVSRNNQIEYLADFSTWARAHEELKAKILTDFRNFENLINQSVEWGEKLNAWTEKNIFEKDLSKFSSPRLISLLRIFIDMQEDEYAYGTALSALDFSDFSFVEGNLNKILKEKVPEDKFRDYHFIFTEPEDKSFAQDQEEDLLNLINIYWSNVKWKKDIIGKSFDEVKVKYPEFYSNLSKHTKKYAWVYYVYMGPAFVDKDFYAFVVDYVSKNVEPQKRLNELKEKRKRIVELKNKYLQELKPTGLDESFLRIASKVVFAKPRRKDYQSKSYYHIEKLYLEIAKRLFISLEQTHSLPVDMMERALNGEWADLSIADSIKDMHVCLPNDDGTITTLIGQEAEEFSRNKIKRNKAAQDLSEVKEFKGSIACRGKAVGSAKIINLPKDMIKMEQGNILVSAATTPSIISAMKKAVAIVTDEGGLTCHAAIVSREMEKPCIVGTKVATRVLKDGDLVEVDADRGVVRILKRK